MHGEDRHKHNADSQDIDSLTTSGDAIKNIHYAHMQENNYPVV